jgi:hypothetical protein
MVRQPVGVRCASRRWLLTSPHVLHILFPADHIPDDCAEDIYAPIIWPEQVGVLRGDKHVFPPLHWRKPASTRLTLQLLMIVIQSSRLSMPRWVPARAVRAGSTYNITIFAERTVPV